MCLAPAADLRLHTGKPANSENCIKNTFAEGFGASVNSQRKDWLACGIPSVSAVIPNV